MKERQANLESTSDRMVMSIAQMMGKLLTEQPDHASTMTIHEEALVGIRTQSNRMAAFQEHQEQPMHTQNQTTSRQQSDNDRLVGELIRQQQSDS